MKRTSAQAAIKPASAEQHMLRIILGLMNPMPDRHTKGCLANSGGPCICGYSDVAGEYLWALRSAKAIAAEHFGQVEIEDSIRLQEPHVLVAAAATLCGEETE